MRPLRTAARALLAWMFLQSGVDVLRNPGPRAALAGPTIEKLQERIPVLPEDRVAVVRANAALQIGAAILLARGRLQRLAALALAGSLVPTTIAGHPFWRYEDPQQRAQQRTHFNKNLAMMGGLLAVATEKR